MTEIPTLDSDRTAADAEIGREVLADCGVITAAIQEIDGFCDMPVRVSRNAAAGWTLEIGPYDLDHRDIERIREAIRQYDERRLA